MLKPDPHPRRVRPNYALEYFRYQASLYRRFIGVFAGTLLLDQVTKMVTVLCLPATGYGWATGANGRPVEVIPGFFNLVHVYNDGAAFSILRGYGWLLVLLAFGALAGIFVFRRALELRKHSRQWIFGLLTAGILGNALDRVVHGKVVDFLDFELPLWGHWPAFNVADIAICVGVAIYIIVNFREDRAKSATTATAAVSPKPVQPAPAANPQPSSTSSVSKKTLR